MRFVLCPFEASSSTDNSLGVRANRLSIFLGLHGELWEKAVAYLCQAGSAPQHAVPIVRSFHSLSGHLGRCIICPRLDGEASWKALALARRRGAPGLEAPALSLIADITSKRC
jgi:hypothetical protein